MKWKTLLAALLLGATQIGLAAPMHPMNIESSGHSIAANAIHIEGMPSIQYGEILAGGPNTKFDHVARKPNPIDRIRGSRKNSYRTPRIDNGELFAGGPNTKFDYVAQMPSIQYEDVV